MLNFLIKITQHSSLIVISSKRQRFIWIRRIIIKLKVDIFLVIFLFVLFCWIFVKIYFPLSFWTFKEIVLLAFQLIKWTRRLSSFIIQDLCIKVYWAFLLRYLNNSLKFLNFLANLVAPHHSMLKQHGYITFSQLFQPGWQLFVFKWGKTFCRFSYFELSFLIIPI